MVKPLVMVTAAGEQHGLINTLTNAVPFDDFKHMEPSVKAKVEKEKKEDSRMVKVEYIARAKNERLDKHYCRYSGDPIQQWHMIPGYTYEVPYGLVKEVNSASMPKRSGLLSVDGKDVNGGAPLEADKDGEWIHKLIPCGF